MNDSTLIDLRTSAERAVRPVRAAVARKRRMREELLAHLTAIFEEEAEKLSDEQAALDRAKERFGDAQELSAQIQGTVPWTEWFTYFTERFILFREGESVLAHAARSAAFISGLFAINLLLVPLALMIRGRPQEIGRMEFAFFAACIVLSGLFFGMTLLGHGIREAMFRGASARSLPLAVVYSLTSALLVPVGGFIIIWISTGDVASGYAHFRFLSWFAFLVPVVLIAAVRQIATEAWDDNEWESLQID